MSSLRRLHGAFWACAIALLAPASAEAADCWERAPAWVCRGTGASSEQGRVLDGVASIEMRESPEQSAGYAAARATHELWRAWASYLDLLTLAVHGVGAAQPEGWVPPPWPPSGAAMAGTSSEHWVTPDGAQVFARASVSLEAVLGRLAAASSSASAARARKAAEAVHEAMLRREAPVQSRRPPEARRVRRVSVGTTHSCAVVGDGRVACWGANDYGQLGLARAVPPAPPVPRLVAGIEGAVGVTAGTDFSCAWTAAGEVYCWGAGHLGQLGYEADERCVDPNQYVRACSSTARALGLRDVVQVAAGGNHACAVDRAGGVQCWGASDQGQLGVTPSDHCTVASPTNAWGQPCARRPVSVPRLDRVTRVALGYDHTCAITAEGHLRCWGSNAFGALGPRQDGACASGACDRPGSVHGIGEVLGVAAGYRFSCAWKADGAALCWGDNSRGQLGAPPRKDCSSNAYARCLSGPVHAASLGPVAAMCAGTQGACALGRDGRVACWGAAGAALARREVQACSEIGCGQAPRGVEVPSPVEEIDCESAVCARSATGELFCWGRNLGGNVGDGTLIERNTPRGVRF